MPRQFKDSNGRIGKPKLAPTSEVLVQSRPASKTLQKLYPRSGNIQIMKVRTYYYINVSELIGDKIRIKSRDMKRLAKWILGGSYEY